MRLWRPAVLAVLAVRGETALRRTLAALAAQTRPPDDVVLVDLRPGDAPELKADLLGDRRVIRLPAGSALPDAVHAAAASTAAPAQQPEETWLWLLHDDSQAAPNALQLLLEAVETSPSVVIAGCKQVDLDDWQRLLDVGFTVSPLGSLVTGLDRHEVDQGQHDARSDMLAVDGAGMLIRRDVWAALGGPDPALRHARDDLDLCTRAHLAGHRVVVVPQAVVARNARPAASYRSDRRDALHLRFAATPWLLGPLVALWSIAAAVVRAVFRLILKQPARAADELLAITVACWPVPWWRARRRARRTRRVPARTLWPLLATPRQLWRQRHDALSAWVVPRGTLGLDGRGAQHREPVRVKPVGRLRNRVFAAGVVLCITGFAAVSTWRSLVGGAPVRRFLAPAPDSLDGLWMSATSQWRPTGLGMAGLADPLLGVLALPAAAAQLLGGSAQLPITALLVLGLPLAALAAFWAAATITPSTLVRSWAALIWAAAPTLLAVTADGRIGTVLAHVCLPPAAVALMRATTRPGSVAAAAAAGLALTVVLAGAPSLAVPVVLILLALAVVVSLDAWRRATLLIVTAAIPLLILLPWWWAVLHAPRLLLADPAAPTQLDAVTGAVAGSGWPSLSGRFWTQSFWFSGPPLPLPRPFPLWLSVPQPLFGGLLIALVVSPVLVLGVAAIFRRGSAAMIPVALAWLTALAGLVVALSCAGLTIGSYGAGSDPVVRAAAHPAPGLSLFLLGLLIAALIASRGLQRRRRAAAAAGSRFGWRVGAAAACLALLAAPVAALAGWAVLSAGQPEMHLRALDPLPVVAAAQAQGPAGTRTLVLRIRAQDVRWTLARGAGPLLGDDSMVAAARRTLDNGTGRDSRVIIPLVAGLLADNGQDLRARFADLAVGSVFLLTPVADQAALALDSSPGLTRVTATSGGVLWRVDLDSRSSSITRPARVRVLDAAGRIVAALPSAGVDVDTEVAPGPPGRLVVLAERADPGWQASVDGEPLTRRVHSGWAQAFELPASGGHVEISRAGGWASRLLPVQLGAALLGALIALPLRQLRGRVARPAPPRPSRPVRRAAGEQLIELPAAPQIFGDDHPEEGAVTPLFTDPGSADPGGADPGSGDSGDDPKDQEPQA